MDLEDLGMNCVDKAMQEHREITLPKDMVFPAWLRDYCKVLASCMHARYALWLFSRVTMDGDDLVRACLHHKQHCERLIRCKALELTDQHMQLTVLQCRSLTGS